MSLFSAEVDEKGSIVLSGGQVLSTTHKDGQCLGKHCPLHNPSNHEYRNFPLFFNGVNMLRKISESETVVDPDDYNLNNLGFAVLKNSAKCLNCEEVLVSENRHDFKQCSCGNVFVDGGLHYIRRGVEDSFQYLDLSETVEK